MQSGGRSALEQIGWQARELQQIVGRLFRIRGARGNSFAPDVDLPERERHAAVEREAERREHEEH